MIGETGQRADVMVRWSALVLARLDAVVEEHGCGPDARAAVLEAIAALAAQRRPQVQALLPLLDDPAFAPVWQRHCRYVALAAGGDVSAEMTALLRQAVVAEQTPRAVRRDDPCLALLRRGLRRPACRLSAVVSGSGRG